MGKDKNRHAAPDAAPEVVAPDVAMPDPEPSTTVADDAPKAAPIAKKRPVPEGHVRVRTLKGVMMLEGFFGAGNELTVSIAEYERRESRGEFELID